MTLSFGSSRKGHPPGQCCELLVLTPGWTDRPSQLSNMPLKFVDWDVEIDGAAVEKLTFLYSRNWQWVAFTSVDQSLAKEFTLSGMDSACEASVIASDQWAVRSPEGCRNL